MTEEQAQLEQFLGKYLPEIADIGREAIAFLRARFPGWDALAYDNYNALAVGFSPDGSKKVLILSVALYPRWVSLFVSARLDDPLQLLKGGGSSVRHVVLEGGAGDLAKPEIAAFLDQTERLASSMCEPGRQGRLRIESISAKQRPRRPGGQG